MLHASWCLGIQSDGGLKSFTRPGKVADARSSSPNCIRWAIILAVVATRIERLKRLGRAEPERPATDELTPIEIEVLLALKRRQKKRTEAVPDGTPTIAQARGQKVSQGPDSHCKTSSYSADAI
jgi:hypothetical protein